MVPKEPTPRTRCPICGKATLLRFRPFCSARCQTMDLARWIGGNYRIPSEAGEELEETRGDTDADE